MLDEIRATLDCGIYFPALATTLLVPDACGAVEFSGTGEKPRDRYRKWYKQWVLPNFGQGTPLTEDAVYKVRNATMHEFSGFSRGIDGFDRMVFFPPHDHGPFKINGITTTNPPDPVALMVPIVQFYEAIAYSVRQWLVEVNTSSDPTRREALGKLFQFRPGGYPPNVIGVPVIS